MKTNKQKVTMWMKARWEQFKTFVAVLVIVGFVFGVAMTYFEGVQIGRDAYAIGMDNKEKIDSFIAIATDIKENIHSLDKKVVVLNKHLEITCETVEEIKEKVDMLYYD